MQTYQHKRNSTNETVQGKDDIKQCVKTIASTQKGSVPLMPGFGCDLEPVVGEKSEIAIDYLIGVYSKEIPVQEPRCNVTEVVGELNEDGRLKMTIYFTEKTSGNQEFTEVYI